MKNHDTTQHSSPDSRFSSSVGGVVDVATPSTRKLRALGLLWALITLFPLAIINYAIFNTLYSDDPILSLSHPLRLMGAALMPVLGWFALGSALQRFYAAATDDRFFRAGPGGISVSLPDDSGSATFRFSFRTIKFDLSWQQIKTWYPYVQSMNGIPTERSIVFETLKGEKVKIQTYHFAEKQKQIAARIDRARSLPLDLEQTNVGAINQQELPNVPRGVGETSFQIKKKRDKLKEIDLRDVAISQRGAYIEKIADVLEAKFVSLCPTAAGYRLSRKHYRPFREWKNVFGIRLFVQHGLLSGYEIQVEPNDSECRTLTISMCPSSLIADFRKYVSIATGVVFLLLSFRYMPVVEDSLGDFAQLAPLVLLVGFLLVVAAATGLMQIPITLLRLLVAAKQKEEAQRKQIRVGVKEVASGAFV